MLSVRTVYVSQFANTNRPTKRQSEAFCSVSANFVCWSPKTRSYALLVRLSPERFSFFSGV